MPIRKMTREDSDFYYVLGPVFGSRSIEHITHDRFYDDPEKVWYVAENAAASMLYHSIRNFYAANGAVARELLKAMLSDHSIISGIVPNRYQDAFDECGFSIRIYSKNFIEVAYEAD